MKNYQVILFLRWCSWAWFVPIDGTNGAAQVHTHSHTRAKKVAPESAPESRRLPLLLLGFILLYNGLD